MHLNEEKSEHTVAETVQEHTIGTSAFEKQSKHNLEQNLINSSSSDEEEDSNIEGEEPTEYLRVINKNDKTV